MIASNAATCTIGWAEGFGRRGCTQRDKVEYLSPVRRANCGTDSLLRSNAARMSRRWAFDTRNRPLGSATTGTFGITVAADELSDPFVAIIALRTTITARI